LNTSLSSYWAPNWSVCRPVSRKEAKSSALSLTVSSTLKCRLYSVPSETVEE
jgi:hypothetical protein